MTCDVSLEPEFDRTLHIVTAVYQIPTDADIDGESGHLVLPEEITPRQTALRKGGR